MPTPQQIAAIIRDTVHVTHDDDGVLHKVDEAAEKIAALWPDDGAILVSAAQIENEVTSTLINMVAATVLATLINTEGGGRTNVTISPGEMQAVLSEWEYTVETKGMYRTIRIAPKNPADWTDEKPPSKLESLLMGDHDDGPATSQAPEHEYTRPLWAVNYLNKLSGRSLMRCYDQADAERQIRAFSVATADARIENRWCLHPGCPTTGCQDDPTRRDTQGVV